MEKYQCDGCGYTAPEERFNEARDLSMRLDEGGTYTHLECPKADCGALAYPVKPKPRRTRQLKRNRERGERIDPTLELYKRELGEDGEPDRDTLQDLLTDIRHYCDTHKIDMGELIRMSEIHHAAELNGE